MTFKISLQLSLFFLCPLFTSQAGVDIKTHLRIDAEIRYQNEISLEENKIIYFQYVHTISK